MIDYYGLDLPDVVLPPSASARGGGGGGDGGRGSFSSGPPSASAPALDQDLDALQALPPSYSDPDPTPLARQALVVNHPKGLHY